MPGELIKRRFKTAIFGGHGFTEAGLLALRAATRALTFVPKGFLSSRAADESAHRLDGHLRPTPPPPPTYLQMCGCAAAAQDIHRSSVLKSSEG
jgi:hypothetical protein